MSKPKFLYIAKEQVDAFSNPTEPSLYPDKFACFVPASELEAAQISIALREVQLVELNKRIEELEAIISHLPKVPTQPYEKELAQKNVEIEKDLRMVREIGVESQRRVNEQQTKQKEELENKVVKLEKLIAFHIDGKNALASTARLAEKERNEALDMCERLAVSLKNYHQMVTFGTNDKALQIEQIKKAASDIEAFELWKKERVK